MTEVDIICVGNIREAYYKEAVSEYAKRLSGFCALSETEIKEEKCDTDQEIPRCLAREGEKIQSAFPKKAYKIALCVEGKPLSSEELAMLIREKSALSPIAFVIGSSCGLSDEVKNACDFRLSFSKMTLPHRLMRVVLYEQIYRAFTIINGKKYHK